MPPSVSFPGAHPDPPADLATRALPIATLEDGWYRLHAREHVALFFGRTGRNRFDAPAGEFGVLYLADTPHSAFVETYGRTERPSRRIVTVQELAGRNLALIRASRPLHVVDLTGSGLVRLGADNRLATGNYRVAQHWSLALWRHPDTPDGLRYRSRHDPSGCCLALFDRAAEVLEVTPMGSLVDPANAALLAEILDRYAIGLVD